MDAAPSWPLVATVTIALLAERHATQSGDRIHAVAAWTDQGERRCAWLAAPVATGPSIADLRLVGRPVAVQLALDLDAVADTLWPSSSGLTWATWTLASVPAAVRTMPLDAAVTALARQLDEAA